MLPLPPRVKLAFGVVLAGLLASGQFWLQADSSIAWLPPILSVLTFFEAFVTVPPAAAKKLAEASIKITDLTAKMAGMSGVLLLAGALGLSNTSCKGVNFPQLDKVEQIVLNDLASCGATPACVQQMESDVATLIAGQAGADAVKLLNDALTLLVDAGLVPADLLPKARSVLATEHLKLAGDP
jgi:hypothetical protein